MALSPEHDVGFRDEPTRRWGQALDTVFAHTHDRQPATRCGILLFGEQIS